VPWLKSKKKVPSVLSPDEVASIIQHTKGLKYKTIFMTVYAFESIEQSRIFNTVNFFDNIFPAAEGPERLVREAKRGRFSSLIPIILRL
jgi:hypothetical protein